MDYRPRVSIIMPVYNGATFLMSSITSILTQTWSDFELIVVDDGSTDGSSQVLSSFDDTRIIRITQSHQGLIASLNCGIAAAKGEYVARMDSDDIALPLRLQRQVEFLQTHKDVGLLGTSYRIIDRFERWLDTRMFPLTDVEIRWSMLLSNPFGHPTVMLRRSILEEHILRYDDRFTAVEDYELWSRTLLYTAAANLPEPLLLYREHSTSVTQSIRDHQLQKHDEVAFRAITTYLPAFKLGMEEVRGLRRFFVGDTGPTEPSSNSDRVGLVSLYLGMFEAFTVCYPGLECLPGPCAAKAVRIVLRAPFQSGSVGIIKRIASLSPGLLSHVLYDAVKGVVRRLKRRIIELLPT